MPTTSTKKKSNSRSSARGKLSSTKRSTTKTRSSGKARSQSATKSKSSSRGKSKSSSNHGRSSVMRGKSSPSGSRSSSARSSRNGSQTRSQRTRGGSARSAQGRKAGGSNRQSSGNVTIDHDEIREWVEARGGKPATVEGTERRGQDAGLLRIDFPGYAGQSLVSIDWDEFFEKFEEAKLAFLHDPKPKSKFNKFIARGKKRF